MAFTRLLLAGLAQHLEDSGAGTWQESGVYPAGTVRPIFVSAQPATPDRCFTLTAYGSDDDPGLTDDDVLVQLRTRGTRDPRVADDDADAAFDALQGLRDVELGGLPVTLVHRMSWSPLGADDNGRFERTDNYRVRTTRPSPHRFD